MNPDEVEADDAVLVRAQDTPTDTSECPTGGRKRVIRHIHRLLQDRLVVIEIFLVSF